MQHTFSYTFSSVVLHDYNVKLSETSCLQLVSRFIEEMSHVSSLTFFSLAHRALIFTLHLVAASISYFLTADTKFSCCSFNKISVSFVFYPPPLPLSLSFVEFHCVFSVPSHEIFPGIFSGNRRFSLPFLDLDECVQGSHDCLHLIDN